MGGAYHLINELDPTDGSVPFSVFRLQYYILKLIATTDVHHLIFD